MKWKKLGVVGSGFYGDKPFVMRLVIGRRFRGGNEEEIHG